MESAGQPIEEQEPSEPIEPEPTGTTTGQPATPKTYQSTLQRVLRLLLAVILAAWLLRLWGITMPFEGRFAEAIIDILVTLFVAHLIWEFTKAQIQKKLDNAGPKPKAMMADDEHVAQVGTRDRSHTLLPLLRKAVGVVLVVMVSLIILSAVGVDIGPLLAGAGVIGLAVGFGAQTLVRDIVSGIFYLIDDAFSSRRLHRSRQRQRFRGTHFDPNVEVTQPPRSRPIYSLQQFRYDFQLQPRPDRGEVQSTPSGRYQNFQGQKDHQENRGRDDGRRRIWASLHQTAQRTGHQGYRRFSYSLSRSNTRPWPPYHFLIKREAFSRIALALKEAGITFAHRKVTVEMPESAKAQALPPPSAQGEGEANSDEKK